MIIKPANKSHRGWTLVEMMVATGVFAIAGLALSTIFIFSIRSFAALENYCTLDRQNRVAMDKLTLEIRQAKQVVSYDTNATSLTILNGDNDQVTYSFNSGLKQMT